MTAELWTSKDGTTYIRVGNGPWRPTATVQKVTMYGSLPTGTTTATPMSTGSTVMSWMSPSSWVWPTTPTFPTEAPPDEAPPLEEVEGDMPILAHRAAALSFNHTGIYVRPLHFHERLELDADAVCKAEVRWGYDVVPKHQAPDENCQCGFYAVPPDVDSWHSDGTVDLLVELSGTVIEHDLGYRAEHQRVIQMTLPRCPLCLEPSEIVIFRGGQSTRIGCRGCFGDVKTKGAYGPVVDRKMLERHIPLEIVDADARAS